MQTNNTITSLKPNRQCIVALWVSTPNSLVDGYLPEVQSMTLCHSENLKPHM